MNSTDRRGISRGPAQWGAPPLELGDRRVLHPGRWRWLRAMAWMVALFFLTAGAFGLPLQWAVDRLPASPPAQFAGLLVACVAALGCYAVAVRFGEGRGAHELALRPAVGGLLTGALLGLGMMCLLMGALALVGAYDITVVGAVPAWTGVGMAVQAAVTEELWMRALLFRLLWRAFGPIPALALSALVFSALHLANPGATVLAGATVTMAGVMFCALYASTGRLWLPIGVHAAWNLAQGYLFGAAVSGGDLGGSIALSTARAGAPTWLTGGTFGPEASVLALTLITAVTVAALVRVGRPGRRRRVRPPTTPPPFTSGAVLKGAPPLIRAKPRKGVAS